MCVDLQGIFFKNIQILKTLHMYQRVLQINCAVTNVIIVIQSYSSSDLHALRGTT